MSEENNLFCEYLILKKHNPKKIIEIGTGAAGWALTINELLNDNNLEFFLIEDFRQTNYTGFEWWPDNLHELNDYILSKNQNFNYILQKNYNEIQDITADVIRFDAWGLSLKDYKRNIKNITENSVIFFDDFSFNKDPDLIILVLELAKEKLIHPMWASETVSCWSRSKYYSNQIKSHLIEHKDIIKEYANFDIRHSYYRVLDMEFDIVQARS